MNTGGDGATKNEVGDRGVGLRRRVIGMRVIGVRRIEIDPMTRFVDVDEFDFGGGRVVP